VGDRQNTTVRIFDPKSPNISAFQMHEWIHENLRLQETDIRMIQIDGPRRRVYIKFVHNEGMRAILEMTRGQLKYHYDTGEFSTVIVEEAGMGVRKVRIANLPPETLEPTPRGAMSKLGDVKKNCGRKLADIKFRMAYGL